jgi:peptidylprolyl isomerase
MKKILLYVFLILNFQIGNVMAEQNNILLLELKDGVVEIETFPEVAPNHVKRVTELVNEGFYDGLKFHRVIDGFMAQTGDPDGNGTGGTGQNIDAEFSDITHEKGIISMARAFNPNSADSQFFIVLDDSPHLDGQYTVWGKVVKGIEFVDNIKKGDSLANGEVDSPDVIISFKVAK